ncbi:hypothetical protein [Colwellia polaris]|jgi:hypothetical protein|uniref:hypothetical protein n=1 Tax=Colwellia polaris TaxID=326537 RepID=UPI001E287F2C|nr:hypothetical protein [Colwellia polaris]
MKIKIYFYIVMLTFSPVILALPKVTISYSDSNGFARIKIKNETFEPLACYVAIDGHKVKFKLQGQSSSRWISATDKRFNYQNFSSWCDYLELHPNYQAY